MPTLPATTSELAAPTTTTNSEEKTAAPKSAAEKTKKEEVSAACRSIALSYLGLILGIVSRPGDLFGVVRDQPAHCL